MVLIRCLLVIVLLALSGAHKATAETAVRPRTLGAESAPVTVTEYVSLTCSHCAAFHTKVFSALKRDYIDTGKVRWVLNDFPLDGTALRAAALAHCVPEPQYWPFVTVLFENQAAWALAPDPVQTLSQYALLAGLSAERATACLSDPVYDQLIALRAEGEKKGVKSTPTFLLTTQDGRSEILSGEQTHAQFEKVLKGLLKHTP